jgi:hypothetical protein
VPAPSVARATAVAADPILPARYPNAAEGHLADRRISCASWRFVFYLHTRLVRPHGGVPNPQADLAAQAMTVQRGMKGSGHARWFERSRGELQRSTFLPFYLSTFLPSNLHYLHLLHKLV